MIRQEFFSCAFCILMKIIDLFGNFKYDEIGKLYQFKNKLKTDDFYIFFSMSATTLHHHHLNFSAAHCWIGSEANWEKLFSGITKPPAFTYWA